jgi:hypothetical protein
MWFEALSSVLPVISLVDALSGYDLVDAEKVAANFAVLRLFFPSSSCRDQTNHQWVLSPGARGSALNGHANPLTIVTGFSRDSRRF